MSRRSGAQLSSESCLSSEREIYLALKARNGENKESAVGQGPCWVDHQNEKWTCSHSNCDGSQEENTALLRCNVKKCNKYLHVSCAVNIQSCFLNEDGHLWCECETHYKPVIFCSCKKSYDPDHPMIQCDTCREWYHESCEGLISGLIGENDVYKCKSCRSSKHVSQDKFQENIEKEERYYSNSNGNDGANDFLNVVEVVCPMLDAIRGVGAAVALNDLTTASNLLTDTLSNDQDQPSNLKLLLGGFEKLEEWNAEIQSFVSQYHEWRSGLETLLKEFFQSFVGNLESNDQLLLTDMISNMNKYENIRKENFSGIVDKYPDFVVMQKVFQDIAHYLSSVSDTSLSSGQLLSLFCDLSDAVERNIKGVPSLVIVETDKVCRSFKDVRERAIEWHRVASALLKSAAGVDTVQSVEGLIAAGGALFVPFRTELQTLEEWNHQYQTLRSTFESILSQNSFQSVSVTAVLHEAKSLKIHFEYVELLQLLSACENYRTQHQRIACGSQRTERKFVEESLALGRELLKNIASAHYPIFAAAANYIEQAQAHFQELLIKADEMAKSIADSLLDGSQENEVISSKLKALHVIVIEELLLDFRKSCRECVPSAEAFLVRTEPESIENAFALLNTLRRAFTEGGLLLDRLPQENAKLAALVQTSLHEKKNQVASLINQIDEVVNNSQKLWTDVDRLLDDIHENDKSTVTIEDIQSLLSVADSQKLISTSSTDKATALLSRGDELSRQCESALQSMENTDVVTLKERMEDMVRLIRGVPIHEQLRLKIVTRYHAVKAALLLKDLLSVYPVDPSNWEELKTQGAMSETVRSTLAKLDHELKKDCLSDARLTPFERAVLVEAKRQCPLLQWKCDVHMLLSSSTLQPVDVGKRLLAQGLSQGFMNDNWHALALKESISKFDEKVDRNLDLIARLEAVRQGLCVDSVNVDSDVIARISTLLTWYEHFVESFKALRSEAQALLESFNAEAFFNADSKRLADFEVLMKLMDSAGAFLSAAKRSLTDENKSFTLPEYDMKFLLELRNSQAQLQSEYFQCSFVSKFFDFAQDSYNAVFSWNNEAQFVFPVATPRKLKSVTQLVIPQQLTEEKLTEFIQRPIARILCSPAHFRVHLILKEVEKFRAAVGQFLFPDDFLMSPTSEIIAECKGSLKSLKEQCESLVGLGSDNPYFALMQWLLDLFDWLSSTLNPFATTRVTMPLKDALSVLNVGKPLLDNALQSPIVTRLLVDLHVYVDSRAHRFASAVCSPLRQSQQFLQFLQSQITAAEELEQSINAALNSSISAEGKLDLLERSKKLLVTVDIKRLDKRGSDTKDVKIKKEDKAKIVVKSEVAVAPVAPTEAKATHRCLSCDRAMFVSGNYCSEKCAVERSAFALDTLLTYKSQLRKVLTENVSEQKVFENLDNASIDKIKADTQMFAANSDVIQSSYFVADRHTVDSSRSYLTSRVDSDVIDKIVEARTAGRFYRRLAVDKIALSVPMVGLSLLDASEFPVLNKKVQDKNADLVSKIQISFEEFFSSLLEKNEVTGAAFLGISLGRDVTSELRRKHTDSKSQLLKDKLLAQQQLLLSNLRQPHNFQLIEKLLSRELTISKLLSMTVVEFADKSTQLKRQEYQQSLVSGAQRVSTEQELETKRRQTEANTESWRDKTVTDTKISLDVSSAPGAMLSLSFNSADDAEVPHEDDNAIDLNYVDDGEEDEMDSESRSNPLEPTDDNQTVALAQDALTSQNKAPISPPKAIKRNINVHAPTIYSATTMERPTKVMKTSNEGFSMLDALKNKQKTVASGLPVSASSSAAHSRRKESQYTPCMKFINQHGEFIFSIASNDGNMKMKATALISDSRLQGVVSPAVVINGRSKIAAIEQSVTECIQSGRRIVATVAFLIGSESNSDVSYRAFVKEYTNTERAAFITVSASMQLYLIPPSLKAKVTVLRPLSIPREDELMILWGVLVSKNEVGPDYLTAESNNPVLPLEESSFAQPPMRLPTSPSAMQSARLPLQVDTVTPRLSLEDRMRQVAESIVLRGGVQSLTQLQAAPESKVQTPFIFAGHPDYNSFLAVLKTVVDLKKQAADQTSARTAVNAFGVSNAFAGTNAFGVSRRS